MVQSLCEWHIPSRVTLEEHVVEELFFQRQSKAIPSLLAHLIDRFHSNFGFLELLELAKLILLVDQSKL